MNVLLIAGQPEAELLSRGIERLGLGVDAVADSRQGLELLAEGRYGAVVFRYLLPYLNGLELLGALNEMQLATRPKTVMISHIHTPQLIRSASAAGLDCFFPAPIDWNRLMNTLNDYAH